jgi:hypothetical protein
MMPSRSDWEASTPKCPQPITQTLSGGKFYPRACGRPMRWHMDDDSGLWVCPVHGVKVTGREAADRAGLIPWRVKGEAA